MDRGESMAIGKKSRLRRIKRRDGGNRLIDDDRRDWTQQAGSAPAKLAQCLRRIDADRG